VTSSISEENELLVARLRWLIIEQEIRPEDIQVLSFSRHRVASIADAVSNGNIQGIDAIHIAFNDKEKDQRLGQKGRLTLSTVASAKGYDAFCVLLASANEFSTDVVGRASFYVGCTRAIEYLEVFAYEKKGLAAEMEALLKRMES
jgi:superfamily I DNA/RNA helicase